MSHAKHWISLWLPVVIWAWVIFHLSGIPYLRIIEGPLDFWLRKAAHMMVYAILARLIARALTGTWVTGSWPKIFLLSLLLCALYAWSDEYHQTFVTGRVGSPRDVAIDTTGAWLALGIIP